SIDLKDSRPEPDLAWLKPGRYTNTRPRADQVLLLIEVADSSLSGDLTEKATLYAEFGVAEYWVVDVQGKCIHVFANPCENGFTHRRTAAKSETLSPACQPDAVLNLAELFI
ncbi:MAG: Uma2 family endonuclease, partial [Planctomycetales bacterium]|nr:Uma2 family endonuclease [Planctomycetales bacterium]